MTNKQQFFHKESPQLNCKPYVYLKFRNYIYLKGYKERNNTIETQHQKHHKTLSTYPCEENKMLKACVQMSFFLQANNLLKM